MLAEMQAEIGKILDVSVAYLPSILGAMVVLGLGVPIAFIFAAATRAAVRRTKVDSRVANWIGGKETADRPDLERLASKSVFYLVILFVVIAFLHLLGLTVLTDPLNRFLVEVFHYAPRIVGAALLLFVAWLLARSVKFMIVKSGATAKWDEHLRKEAGIDETVPSLSQSFGQAAYWLVFLLFLPAVLSALALEGMLEPVRAMLSRFLVFLPNVFAAIVIVAVGWFVARFVKMIVSNLLVNLGLDKLSEQVGLTRILGAYKLSGVLSWLVFTLIIVPVVIGALNALGIDALTEPASAMLSIVLAALPAILVAALITAIAYVAGSVISRLATDLLTNVGFDKILAKLGLGKEPSDEATRPSQVGGYLVFATIMIFAVIEALEVLGLTALSGILMQFALFAVDVLLGLVIFALGLWLASVVAKIVSTSGKPQAGSLAAGARILILILAGAIALRQIGVADEVINMAFGFAIGAVAVGAALAFGLGGRDIAAKTLEYWSEEIKSKKDTD